jgi:hypothetical protein
MGKKDQTVFRCILNMQTYPLVRRAGGVVDATFHGLDGKEEVPNYKCTKIAITLSVVPMKTGAFCRLPLMQLAAQ